MPTCIVLQHHDFHVYIVQPVGSSYGLCIFQMCSHVLLPKKHHFKLVVGKCSRAGQHTACNLAIVTRLIESELVLVDYCSHCCMYIHVYSTSPHSNTLSKTIAYLGFSNKHIQQNVVPFQYFRPFSHSNFFIWSTQGMAANGTCNWSIEGIVYRQRRCLFYAIIPKHKNKTKQNTLRYVCQVPIYVNKFTLFKFKRLGR